MLRLLIVKTWNRPLIKRPLMFPLYLGLVQILKFRTTATLRLFMANYLQPSSLKWMVLFGSVSGRFGNHGQADYAAANDTMARLGRMLNQAWPDSRIVTIDWGPWEGVGMASQGIQSKLLSGGVGTISVDTGRKFLIDELNWGKKADSEVIAGRGPWTAQTDAALVTIFETSFRLLRSSAVVDRSESVA